MSDQDPRLAAESLADAWREAGEDHRRWLDEGAPHSEELAPFVSRETKSMPELLPLPKDVVDQEFSGESFEALSRYANRVLKANQLTNLVSRKDPVTQIRTNILDSLPLALLWEHVSRETDEREAPNFILDAGTGSGVPGIPLQFALPGLGMKSPPLLLVESRVRKAEFLERSIDVLDLERTAIWGERLEDGRLVGWLEETGWPAPGLLTTRGLSSVTQTLRWSRGLVREEWLSRALFIKGAPGIRREWDEEGSSWAKTGWVFPEIHCFFAGGRELCVLEGYRPFE